MSAIQNRLAGMGLLAVRHVRAAGAVGAVVASAGVWTTRAPRGDAVQGSETSSVREETYAAPPSGRSALARVLVVEDDGGIATQMVRGLARAGYEAEHVATGTEALDRPPADVVLLDLGLPDIDGIEVCRRLRARSDAAIIVVTARGEEGDRVLALDEGADDYLVKPFGLAELLARIRAVLRRTMASDTEILRHGDLTVDLRTCRVTVAGREVALTPKEFGILECLATDPGRVVTRQEILEQAWDAHWYGPGKVLDVHMAALRRKLGEPGLIETVYGRGFRLADPKDRM